MKAKKIVFFILMYLPLAVDLIALRFLPDQIPAHYGFDGQADRWGSKYEALLFPAVTVLMGCFMLAMTKLAAKQEEQGRNNEKFMTVSGILTLGLFNVLNGYFLYTSFNRVEDLYAVPLEMNQLVFALLGVLMIVLGNIMPKLRMNSIAGLRTRWSRKNEAVWKRCQRFGGISFIIGGITLIVLCLTVTGPACLAAAFGVWIALIVTDVPATYKISRSIP